MESMTNHESNDTFERSSGSIGAPGAGGLIGSAVIGASLMYFLDPERGAKRRNLVVDRLNHALHVTADATGKTRRDLRNRTKGIAATVRSRLIGDDDADSWVLTERVRTEMGRVVSHPSAIEVSADDNIVTLGGQVLAAEADRLIDRVRKVRGVRDVVSNLEIHETAENVPALQGGVARRGGEFELRQANWTPAARLLMSVAGGALAIYGARRRGPLSSTLGLGGLALLTRALSNTPMAQLAGMSGRRAIDIQKTINIDAPVETVFTYLTDYENWPRFMKHVREVRGTRGGLQHWVVDGPAGTTMEWDAEITRFVENELVSWKSVDGSAVQHAGTVRVDRNDDGSTRAHIRMSYNPPGGVAGHLAAIAFHADPKRQLDDDLGRLKTTIETGTPPRDAAQPSPQLVDVAASPAP